MFKSLNRYLLSSVAMDGNSDGGSNAGGGGGAGGGGNGGGGDGGFEPIGFEIPQDGDDDDSGDDGDQLTDEQLAELQDVFNVESEDEEEEPELDANGKPIKKPSASQVDTKALQTEVQTMLNNMTLPADIIPEDFDPSNRQQLNGVLTTAMKHGVNNAMSVIMKPLGAAMRSLGAEMEERMNARFADFNDKTESKSVLREIVPEYDDPKYSNLVKMLDQTAKAKGKKPLERAKMIRQSLNAMGIKGGKKPTGQGNGAGNRQGNPPSNQQGSVIRVGDDALDMFAPLRRRG